MIRVWKEWDWRTGDKIWRSMEMNLLELVYSIYIYVYINTCIIYLSLCLYLSISLSSPMWLFLRRTSLKRRLLIIRTRCFTHACLQPSSLAILIYFFNGLLKKVAMSEEDGGYAQNQLDLLPFIKSHLATLTASVRVQFLVSDKICPRQSCCYLRSNMSLRNRHILWILNFLPILTCSANIHSLP